MKIWTKIILGFIVVIILMIVVDSHALRNNIHFIDHIEKLEFSKRVELSQSNNIAYSIQRIKSNVRELFLEYEDEDNSEEITYVKQALNESFTLLEKSLIKLNKATTLELEEEEEEEEDVIGGLSEKEELVLIDSLNTMTANFIFFTKNVISLIDQQKIDIAEEVFDKDVEPVSRKIQVLIKLILKDAKAEVELSIRQLHSHVNRDIKVGIYMTSLSIFLALGIGLYISRSISEPLSNLIQGTKEIQNGNLDTTVKLSTKGELQILADSFNQMAKELKTKISSIDKLNKELVASNSTKDTFFSIIAHDLKSPFNYIIGFTDLLEKDYNKFDEVKRQKVIREINKSSKATYELLENLLTWAMSQSNKIEIHIEPLNLASLVEKCLKSYAPNAEKKAISIQSTVLETIEVKADKFTLMVVLNNLINNAIKFTPEGGTISIMAHLSSGNVEICVKDSGVGMSPESVEKLINSEEFTSTKGTHNEKGTGLGLILIKDFIMKNNGKLMIKSEPGYGSEFKFTLPA